MSVSVAQIPVNDKFAIAPGTSPRSITAVETYFDAAVVNRENAAARYVGSPTKTTDQE